MDRYVLIGLRGTGKSTIGKLMAKQLQVPYYDTDALIEEKAGKRIPEIFASSGEAAFRTLEQEAVASVPAGPAVIATGGGSVMDSENARLLRKDAHIIHLTADPEMLAWRIGRGDRPPLTSLEPEEEIRHLAAVRAPVYRGLADLCIDTGSQQVSASVSMIIRSQGIPDRNPSLFRQAIAHIAAENPSELNAEELLSTPLLYGITGNPVSHSKSPNLYNRLFSACEIPGKYLFLPAASAEEAISMMKALGAKGLSVTIPFKEAMISCIDEPDRDALAIGAVNTVVSCAGRLYGHNTDWTGIAVPLAGMRGGRALVVGAGGAAAAAVYALQSLGMEVVVTNRSSDRGEALARRFSCLFQPLSEAGSADLIVNATPVGMKEGDGLPVSSRLLKPGVTVFDLVYTPPMTPLLVEAEASGCRIIKGTEMFVHQAHTQFMLLTGIDPGIERVREAMLA